MDKSIVSTQTHARTHSHSPSSFTSLSKAYLYWDLSWQEEYLLKARWGKQYFLFKILKFFHFVLRLNQRCPTVFLRSPQMWRMNMAISHIFLNHSSNSIKILLKKFTVNIRNRLFRPFCCTFLVLMHVMSKNTKFLPSFETNSFVTL